MQRDTNDNKLRFNCYGICVCILLVGLNDVHPNKMLILTTIRNVKTKSPPIPHTHVIDSIAGVYTIMYSSIEIKIGYE